MKTFLYALVALCIFSMPMDAQKRNEKRVSKTVDVTAFSAIEMNAVGAVRFTLSDTYAVEIEGPAFYMEKLYANVSKGKLVIDAHSLSGDKNKNINNVVIRISAPALNKVEIDGVGSFTCDEKLTADHFKAVMHGVGNITLKELECNQASLIMNGVGNIEATVNCKGKLVANCSGVGKIKVSGKAGSASIFQADFVGHVNSKHLQVEHE